MVFNGFDLSGYLDVEKVSNPPLSGVQITTQAVGGRDGARFVAKNLATRSIKIDVVIAGGTRQEYMEHVRDVARVLYSADVGELSGLPGDDRRYKATLTGWTMEKLMTIGHGSIEFLCCDPYAYGVEHTVPVNTPIQIMGSVAARGVFTLRLPAAISGDLTVTNSKTDAFVRVFGPFKAGDVVEIDTLRGYVTVNGASAMARVDIQSDWFDCTGTLTLAVHPNNVTGVYRYTERWL